MQPFTTPNKIVITCHKWLSPALASEVTALGFSVTRSFQTGVEIMGTINDCIKLNLQLRTASQVLYSIKTFNCNNPDELYENLCNIEWEKIIDPGGYFSVTSNVFHTTITTNLFANLRVKDAVVDHMRKVANKRPSTGSDLTGAVIYLYWKYDEAEVFIDTTGDSLARHGYRKIPGKAPMLEALAAATILSGKWDATTPFINPMCGSGTLAIEAALIASKRVPGLLRHNYAFMHVLGYDSAVYEKERAVIEHQITEPTGLQIIASDMSKQAIDIAKLNAAAAGVEDLITFQVCDFESTTMPENMEGAIILFNPEYGERLGEEIELEATYARMGDFLKNKCKGATGYIFTGNLELAKKNKAQTKQTYRIFKCKNRLPFVRV